MEKRKSTTEGTEFTEAGFLCISVPLWQKIQYVPFRFNIHTASITARAPAAVRKGDRCVSDEAPGGEGCAAVVGWMLAALQ